MNTLKNIFLLIVLIISTTVNAQSIWKGGTPGQEENWHIAANWEKGVIPNIGMEVLIPKTEHLPVISQTNIQVAYLEVDIGAELTITSSGGLTIDGKELQKNGILNKGIIKNKGLLRIFYPGKICIKNVNAQLINEGTITIDYNFNETFFAIHNSTYVDHGAFQIVERGI